MSEMWEDFEEFLQQINELSDLVSGVKAEDPPAGTKARSGYDRTVINSKESPGTQDPGNAQIQCPHGVLQALEQDAECRRQRREERRKVADACRAEGNKAFTHGDYEAAVKHYTEGLQAVRDMEVLYTNRALAYIQLKKYQEAISDCDWALKCNMKSVKAYVHKGRANLALQNYTEAQSCFLHILDIQPEKQKMSLPAQLPEYLKQVELEEKRCEQERRAEAELSAGSVEASTVIEMLKKLERPEQTSWYYCGLLELLREAVTHCSGQTLFRLNNGFSVINSNSVVTGCFSNKSKVHSSVELCVSVLKLWKEVCVGNEENQEQLLSCPGRTEQVMQPLLDVWEGSAEAACVDLLHVLTHSQHGRQLVLKKTDVYRLVGSLWQCVMRGGSSVDGALNILQVLADDNKFQVQMRGRFGELFLPPFAQLLTRTPATEQKVLIHAISLVGSLIIDASICQEAAACEQCWDAFQVAMERWEGEEHKHSLYVLLGLMISLTVNPTTAVQDHAVIFTHLCLKQLNSCDVDMLKRVAALLVRVLQQSRPAVQEAVRCGIVEKLLSMLKGQCDIQVKEQIDIQYATKALSLCTATCGEAREQLLQLDSRLRVLRRLLASSDLAVQGNAALCLSHLFNSRRAATALLGTDIVQLLLSLAGGGNGGGATGETVQRNAAVALGKLCTTEPRHVVKLRELHGFGILHSCMKFIA